MRLIQRKLWSNTALAMVALLLTGCGGAGGNASHPSATTAAGSVQGKSVVLATCSASNGWCYAFTNNIQQTLRAHGVKVTTLTNNFNAAQQSQQVDQAIQQHPDAILILAADTYALVPAVLRAKAAGIPVIDTGGALAATANPGLVLDIESSNAQLATFAAQELVQGLKEEGLKSGNIIEITGTFSQVKVVIRIDAFKKEMAKYPEYKIVAVEDGASSGPKSAAIAASLFTKYSASGGIQGAFGMYDNQAVAIIQSAQSAGLAVGVKAHGLVVVGSNCYPEGIAAIGAGTQYGTATQSPITDGIATANWIVKYLAGESVPTPPAQVLLPEFGITAANVTQYSAVCTY